MGTDTACGRAQKKKVNANKNKNGGLFVWNMETIGQTITIIGTKTTNTYTTETGSNTGP